ncbi:Electron transfer flavoprotein alpha/beta- subunit [Desulfofarcimen acetoxidans DSM 771]|uniref:Electron transfer flavoprotein subunit beta n=1 Tax=Desulfofarcimen acetoxidans (strain ATCC 49208 / DSM 771 / KCTC 5769 / VKM B-1644 / 5575) TaxID=485916 RepID=C8VWX9_DESAS|nr:electron transfer flavoprotein subunit beta/FixA family protein [Desulfofarcimen acetoxidans]ACV62555.1 Electron transfer flavoprotein alpha/beta- subunit [Desulfofarcimen acetoxidans DSM 771]
MKILVLLKQVFDTEAAINISGGKISDAGVTQIINPYDEFAVEEALKIAEVAKGEVTIVTVGSNVDQTVRQALAMGADKGYVIDDAAMADADEYGVAVALAKAISGMEYDLVLAGWRAIDDSSAQVAARVAQALNIPLVNLAVKLEVAGGTATATTEIDGGSAVVEVALPAVITCQKGLNEPRYPSMKGIMKAKKKPIDKVALGALGLDAAAVAAKVKPLNVYLPAARAAGKLIKSEAADAAKEVAKLLREEAKVI